MFSTAHNVLDTRLATHCCSHTTLTLITDNDKLEQTGRSLHSHTLEARRQQGQRCPPTWREQHDLRHRLWMPPFLLPFNNSLCLPLWHPQAGISTADPETQLCR